MTVPRRRWKGAPRASGAGLALLLALACGPQQLEGVPEHLLGVWRTRAPRYEHSFLEMRRDAIVLGVAGLELDVLHINTIDWSSDAEGNATYRFHFVADEGYDDVLEVTRVAGASRAIRVASRAELWTPGER